jgi:hypothetical protein
MAERKFAVTVVALAGIESVNGLELPEYVPVQPMNALKELGVAVIVGVAPEKKLPEEQPTELAGEAAEVPPGTGVSVS